MPTPSIVPRQAGEGAIGLSDRPWGWGYFGRIRQVPGGSAYPVALPAYGSNELVSADLPGGGQPVVVYELADPLTDLGKRRFSVEGVVQTAAESCDVTIQLKMTPENVVKEIAVRCPATSTGLSIPFSLSCFGMKTEAGSSAWQVVATNNHASFSVTLRIVTAELTEYLAD